MLTALYIMGKSPNSKSRYDEVKSTANYLLFEQAKQRSSDRKFKVHCTDKNSFNEHAVCSITSTTDGKNLSSVLTNDKSNRLCGYGDARGTNDALLFIFKPDYSQLEIFVALGEKNRSKQLFSAYQRGKLDAEIQQLRQQAKARDLGLFD